MSNPESKFVVTAEDRATATLKKVAAEFGGLGRAAMSAAGMLAGFGGALSVGVIASQVKAIADLQDGFGKLAQQTGIGVQSLTELDYAARLSDVSTEDLATGVTRLTSKMADVTQGSKEAAAVFDSLGVKVKNSDGTLRSSEEVLKDIAQRFSEFADGSTKTAYAVEIFGRAGAKLIPLLNSGRDGLAEMAEEARALGVVFDEKAAKAAEQFNDNLTRLGQAAQGLKIELLQGLIPPLTDLTQRFLDARAAGVDFIDALDIAANIKGFGTLEEKIADVQRRLNDAQSGKWTGIFGTDVKGLQAKLEKLLKLKERVVGREMGGYETTIDYSAFGRKPSAPPKLPGAAKAAVRIPQAELTYQQKAVIDAANDYDKASRAAEVFALKLKVLDAKFFEQGGSLEDYTAAMQDLTKATATAGTDGVGALEDFAKAWLDELEPMRKFNREMELVKKAVQFDFLTPEQAEAIKKRLSEALKPINEADEFAKQAAKNIQSALGQDLYNVLDGNFKNIGDSFLNMLKRIASEAIAADLSRTLLGDMGKSGKIGGLVGTGLSWLGGVLGIPSHAGGLDYVPYDGYIAKLHRGERVQTAAEAKRSGPQINVTNHYQFATGLNVAEMRAWGEAIKRGTINDIRDQIRRSPDWTATL